MKLKTSNVVILKYLSTVFNLYIPGSLEMTKFVKYLDNGSQLFSEIG